LRRNFPKPPIAKQAFGRLGEAREAVIRGHELVKQVLPFSISPALILCLILTLSLSVSLYRYVYMSLVMSLFPLSEFLALSPVSNYTINSLSALKK
jgi:hypothetical protein